MRIPMRTEFSIIPEGHYTFYIYDVTEDENFGKVVVKMITADGKKYNERFSLKTKDDEWNEGALNAFSFLTLTALDDFSREDASASELVGHYIAGNIVHTEADSTKEPGKKVTFTNLKNIESSDGFDTEPCEKTKKLMNPGEQKPASASGYDLDSLLDE